MTIHIESCISSSIHIFRYCREVHITVTIHTASHFHSIASNSLSEILVSQVLNQRIIQIVVDSSTCTQFKIGILLIIDVILQSLILVQVSVVVVVRLAQLEFLLCHSRH